MSVAYPKDIFEHMGIYSMPTPLFEEARQGLYDASCDVDPDNVLLDVSDLTFFMVVNPGPERRTYVHIPHKRAQLETINVTVYDVIGVRGERIFVHKRSGGHACFDLKTILSNLTSSHNQMFKWYV